MAIYFLQSLQQKETKLRPLFTQAAEPLQGDTLLLTTKLPGVAGTAPRSCWGSFEQPWKDERQS